MTLRSTLQLLVWLCGVLFSSAFVAPPPSITCRSRVRLGGKGSAKPLKQHVGVGEPSTCRSHVTLCDKGSGKPWQQRVGVALGTLYLSQLLILPYTALARLGVISPPPLNTFTAIANAAMDQAIAAGTLQPLMATAWAQSFWFDLLSQYYAAGEPADFVPQYCAEASHAAWCVGLSL